MSIDDKILDVEGGVVQQFYDEKTVTLAAGVRFEVFTVFNYFRVLSLTGSGLSVIFGDNQYETPFTGAGIGVKLQYLLKRMTLINTSGAPLTLTYGIAVGSINDDRLNVSGTITVTGSVSTTTASVLASIADVVIGAAALTAVQAANTARRGLIITNVGANSVRIGDSTTTAAARGAPLLVNQTLTLETQNAVSAFSTLGTTLAVLEY